MKPLAALFLACLANVCSAAEWDFVIHGISKHFRVNNSEGRKYHEENKGLGLRMELHPSFAVQASHLWGNSYGRNSTYLVAEYVPYQFGNVRLGGFAGVADGYPQSPVVVGGGAIARLTVNSFSAALRAIPQVKDHTSGLVTLELGVRR